MMTGKEAGRAFRSRAGGRWGVKTRRRVLRLVPFVLGIGILMIVGSWTTGLTATSRASGNSSLTASSTPGFTGPSGPAPVSNCFGGASPCTGTSTSTTAGEGTTCVISSFSETAGDFLYVAVNYRGSTNVISSVTAGSVSASYIGGEFATSASVAFYDIPSEAGGTVTITVTLSTAEFGDCRAGQLSAGTTVGVVGPGGTTYSATATALSVTNTPVYEPSLLLALFDSTRPSGAWTYSGNPSGSWVTGGNLLTGYNPGTNSYMFGYNDTTSGTVTFSVTLGDTASSGNGNIYLSGIVVEFYIPPAVSSCFGGSPCTGSSTTTTAGEGTTCVISSYSESAGDFLVVAITYFDNANIITSVADGGADTFTYVGGEFSALPSVAFYDAASEHGGIVTITVTISPAEFGSCSVDQLPTGTAVGVVGAGGTTSSGSDTSLSVTNAASHEPSLLLALFGSTRPSGPWEAPLPSGSWLASGFLETGYNPGTNSELIAFNDDSSGTVTFTETLENDVDIFLSGIAVEFYLAYPQNPLYPIAPSPAFDCFGGTPCTGPQNTHDGSGTTCVIPSFDETAGDFLYVAINYLAGNNIVQSVSDGGVDQFSYVGGATYLSAYPDQNQTVLLYDVTSEHGGVVTITVTIPTAEFGTCRAGQLSAGTMVGAIGSGSSTLGESLSTSVTTVYGPSLVMGFFGTIRPSGGFTLTGPSGAWTISGEQLSGYNPGTDSAMYGYYEAGSGTVTFNLDTNSGVTIVGIAVQFIVSSTLESISDITGNPACVERPYEETNNGGYNFFHTCTLSTSSSGTTTDLEGLGAGVLAPPEYSVSFWYNEVQANSPSFTWNAPTTTVALYGGVTVTATPTDDNAGADCPEAGEVYAQLELYGEITAYDQSAGTSSSGQTPFWNSGITDCQTLDVVANFNDQSFLVGPFYFTFNQGQTYDVALSAGCNQWGWSGSPYPAGQLVLSEAICAFETEDSWTLSTVYFLPYNSPPSMLVAVGSGGQSVGPVSDTTNQALDFWASNFQEGGTLDLLVNYVPSTGAALCENLNGFGCVGSASIWAEWQLGTGTGGGPWDANGLPPAPSDDSGYGSDGTWFYAFYQPSSGEFSNWIQVAVATPDFQPPP